MSLLYEEMNNLETDVLILGGGPAGTWAAITAAALGVKVILADKGYCGTSGATAAAGTNVWYVEPDPDKREAAIEKREKLGGFLTERFWMNKALDQTYINMHNLAAWGYPFTTDHEGKPYRGGLQGPDYMKLMRKLVHKAGVKILDHSPALELLSDSEGVCGAIGINKKTELPWRIKAKAIIIATGGCAFLSKTLGCNVLTGDGYLMAAEAGAELSGMEFSNAYAFSPIFSSMTKTAFYAWASFYRADGTRIEDFGGQTDRSIVAKTLMNERVYARIDQVTEEMKQWMYKAQPNFFTPFIRKGIDPFTQKFEITLRYEGTVRGTGGIRIVDETCATSVPGLYVAGDAATRELICGSFTGGGSHNATWAMSSGTWAGEAAAKFSQHSKLHKETEVNRLASTPISLNFAKKENTSIGELITAIQKEVLPLNLNWFRREDKLKKSLTNLGKIWSEIKNKDDYPLSQIVRAREIAAMTATARWMYHSALERKETRGMHRREDAPYTNPDQQYRILSGGLDNIWVKPDFTPFPLSL
ncbi:FAD-dependent oxidoreductase [Metabacillus fastidiosus]|uniref:FAD-dependent oxidoreductase n=1 Tax=Metabacillus fastidiosus TaxID=1458 RepID=UPI0008270C32|nr:FAD-binding protein [Metabacillus fastidiosus]MED4464587.1 FAD-binding protein [Metabacillus fastidiosus]